MTLADIAVHSVAAAPRTENLRPILHEIRHALNALVTEGTHSTIDLYSLPFAPQELEALDAFLGAGEIDLTLNLMGKTRIRESSYAGVWCVEHFDAADQRIGYCIEIGRVPDLLRSQEGDTLEALAAITATLALEDKHHD
jgi:hydrogenase-1 operon protein HyaF